MRRSTPEGRPGDANGDANAAQHVPKERYNFTTTERAAVSSSSPSIEKSLA
jgi:hypothetical protein